MDQATIQQVVDELRPLISARYLGKIFQLSPLSFSFDFGLRDGRYLFVSAEPTAPRLHLIKRRTKDLDKGSIPHSHFSQTMRSRLGGGRLLSVDRDHAERVIRFQFEVDIEHDDTETRSLVVQLTGRSANVFLLDDAGTITAALRESNVPGQSVGKHYQLPPRSSTSSAETIVKTGAGESISAALDAYYAREEEERVFRSRASELRGRIRKQISQKERLKENLKKDLAGHGDAETHRRVGDLLLANIGTVKRRGGKILIQDFYSADSPLIELELEESKSLQDEAARYFALYAKSKRAGGEIAARLSTISRDLEELRQKAAALEEIIERHDDDALAALLSPEENRRVGRSKPQKVVKIPGVRTYKSSDGYEVLVGRGARDNDHLTFRVAGPNDLWLHAGDYPGSHVVVRRVNRKEIPHRTIVEAAQLAARFSQASSDTKVVVHYTPRKFLSKPKGAAPGLVRLSRFKTMLVEPKEGIERS
jgi:predicted ribosome quality control (RQC) complex YloA/Tae2 family protein